MLKYVNYLFALWWTGLFISLFFGYQPDNIIVGIAFINCIFLFLIRK